MLAWDEFFRILKESDAAPKSRPHALKVLEAAANHRGECLLDGVRPLFRKFVAEPLRANALPPEEREASIRILKLLRDRSMANIATKTWVATFLRSLGLE